MEFRDYTLDGNIILWNDSKKDSYYKIQCAEDPEELLKKGLCCAACSHCYSWEDGKYECSHKINRGIIRSVFVEPYQICELISTGTNFPGWYFDGNVFKPTSEGAGVRSQKFFHFATFEKEMSSKLKQNNLNANKFLCFIQRELPDVYKKLEDEFKRKETMND